jgi:SAM-dependent methyltransferase
LRECAIKELTAQTKYQYFDDLGMEQTSSDSAAKFECLRLADVLPPQGAGRKRILDVGAQSGNFCFRMAKMSPSYRVLGVDTNRKSAMLACRYNTQVYELPNVDFKHGNAMDLRQRRFDLIIAASVFHYFREQQQEFLDKVLHMLNPGGFFVLECGVSVENPGQLHVQEHARRVDGDRPCHFPNRDMLVQMTQAFQKTYEGPSVSQKGDPIPRFVFHFQKPAN